jgi:hypothetical protein
VQFLERKNDELRFNNSAAMNQQTYLSEKLSSYDLIIASYDITIVNFMKQLTLANAEAEATSFNRQTDIFANDLMISLIMEQEKCLITLDHIVEYRND